MLPLVSAIVLSASSLLTPAIGPPPQVVGEATVAKIIQYVEAVRRSEIIDYVVADQQGKLTAYVDALAASDAQVAAESQPTYQTPQRAPQAPQTASGGSGDCYTDSPVPDYIINRESGGNPGAVNPSSGAFGCYQELPGHFAPGGACAGLDMQSVADQKACAHRLIDGSGGSLAPWALTR